MVGLATALPSTPPKLAVQAPALNLHTISPLWSIPSPTFNSTVGHTPLSPARLIVGFGKLPVVGAFHGSIFAPANPNNTACALVAVVSAIQATLLPDERLPGANNSMISVAFSKLIRSARKLDPAEAQTHFDALCKDVAARGFHNGPISPLEVFLTLLESCIPIRSLFVGRGKHPKDIVRRLNPTTTGVPSSSHLHIPNGGGRYVGIWVAGEDGLSTSPFPPTLHPRSVTCGQFTVTLRAVVALSTDGPYGHFLTYVLAPDPAAPTWAQLDDGIVTDGLTSIPVSVTPVLLLCSCHRSPQRRSSRPTQPRTFMAPMLSPRKRHTTPPPDTSGTKKPKSRSLCENLQNLSSEEQVQAIMKFTGEEAERNAAAGRVPATVAGFSNVCWFASTIVALPLEFWTALQTDLHLYLPATQQAFGPIIAFALQWRGHDRPMDPSFCAAYKATLKAFPTLKEGCTADPTALIRSIGDLLTQGPLHTRINTVYKCKEDCVRQERMSLLPLLECIMWPEGATLSASFKSSVNTLLSTESFHLQSQTICNKCGMLPVFQKNIVTEAPPVLLVQQEAGYLRDLVEVINYSPRFGGKSYTLASILCHVHTNETSRA